MAANAGRGGAARSAAMSPGMLHIPAVLYLIFDVFSGFSRGEILANRREMRRGPRGNPSLKAATQGEGGGGREVAQSAAGDAGNAKVRLRLVAFAQFPDNVLAILERFFKPRAPQIDVD